METKESDDQLGKDCSFQVIGNVIRSQIFSNYLISRRRLMIKKSLFFNSENCNLFDSIIGDLVVYTKQKKRQMGKASAKGVQVWFKKKNLNIKGEYY